VLAEVMQDEAQTGYERGGGQTSNT